MSLKDLQNGPRWYRWFIYALAGGFIAITIWAGFIDTFIGTVTP